MTATTGPNTSCEHTFISGVASTTSVGREHPVRADLAARRRPSRPRRAASADPAGDAVALAGGDERRDVGRLVERVADDEGADRGGELGDDLVA